MLKRSLILLIAALSVAVSASAEAKPSHNKERSTAGHATIVCNDRGCSDHRIVSQHKSRIIKTTLQKKLRHALPRRPSVDRRTVAREWHGWSSRGSGVRFTPRVTAKIQRKARQEGRHGARHAQAEWDRVSSTVIVCNLHGCSDQRRAAARAEAVMPRADFREVADANGNGGVIVGGRPSGCPRAFCGCEASRYVFGEMRPELYLASNWLRKFPRASAASGMVAVRNHHVMVLISPAGGTDWLVHDGNSGGGKTRVHVRSIGSYAIVDPQGSRSAHR